MADGNRIITSDQPPAAMAMAQSIEDDLKRMLAVGTSMLDATAGQNSLQNQQNAISTETLMSQLHTQSTGYSTTTYPSHLKSAAVQNTSDPLQFSDSALIAVGLPNADAASVASNSALPIHNFSQNLATSTVLPASLSETSFSKSPVLSCPIPIYADSDSASTSTTSLVASVENMNSEIPDSTGNSPRNPQAVNTTSSQSGNFTGISHVHNTSSSLHSGCSPLLGNTNLHGNTSVSAMPGLVSYMPNNNLPPGSVAIASQQLLLNSALQTQRPTVLQCSTSPLVYQTGMSVSAGLGGYAILPTTSPGLIQYGMPTYPFSGTVVALPPGNVALGGISVAQSTVGNSVYAPYMIGTTSVNRSTGLVGLPGQQLIGSTAVFTTVAGSGAAKPVLTTASVSGLSPPIIGASNSPGLILTQVNPLGSSLGNSHLGNQASGNPLLNSLGNPMVNPMGSSSSGGSGAVSFPTSCANSDLEMMESLGSLSSSLASPVSQDGLEMAKVSANDSSVSGMEISDRHNNNVVETEKAEGSGLDSKIAKISGSSAEPDDVFYEENSASANKMEVDIADTLIAESSAVAESTVILENVSSTDSGSANSKSKNSNKNKRKSKGGKLDAVASTTVGSPLRLATVDPIAVSSVSLGWCSAKSNSSTIPMVTSMPDPLAPASLRTLKKDKIISVLPRPILGAGRVAEQMEVTENENSNNADSKGIGDSDGNSGGKSDTISSILPAVSQSSCSIQSVDLSSGDTGVRNAKRPAGAVETGGKNGRTWKDNTAKSGKSLGKSDEGKDAESDRGSVVSSPAVLHRDKRERTESLAASTSSEGDASERLGANAVDKVKPAQPPNRPKTKDEIILEELEGHGVYTSKKSKGKLHCRLCDHRCNNIEQARKHVAEPRHARLELKREASDALRALPDLLPRYKSEVTECIMSVHSLTHMSSEEISYRQQILEKLQQIVTDISPEASLHVYGSTHSGFGSITSDLNVNLRAHDPPDVLKKLKTRLVELVEQKQYSGPIKFVTSDFSSKLPCLTILANGAAGNLNPSTTSDNILPTTESKSNSKPKPSSTSGAKDKGLKGSNSKPASSSGAGGSGNGPKSPPSPGEELTIVLSIGNELACETSALLKLYGEIDERVFPLGVALRHWAKLCKIDDSTNGTLPGYVYILMTIHYLQQCQPPVLPVLHELTETFPIIATYLASKCLEEKNSEEFRYVNNLKELRKRWVTENKEPLGGLWVGLLRYYCFDFELDTRVVTIRQSSFLNRTVRKFTSKKLAVEDPFLIKRNIARSLGHSQVYEFIDDRLRAALAYFGNEPTATAAKTAGTLPTSAAIAKGTGSLSTDSSCLYEFSADILADKKEPPLFCSACQEEGHSKKVCETETLPPIRPLPPLTPQFSNLLNNVLSRVPGDFEPTFYELDMREKLLNELRRSIRIIYPDAELCLFGSSFNGFGFRRSDLDISLTFMGQATADKLECAEIITSLSRHLRKQRFLYDVFPIPSAKVPIVKFKHRHSYLEGDISLYNTLARHNTRMLWTYSKIDERVKILGYVIKTFAKMCHICDASRGSLSSYAYILMMIYYLQRTTPPVIPVLQELLPPTFNRPEVIVDGWNAWFYEDLNNLGRVWDGWHKNCQSVGELWIGLLRFYTERFCIEDEVISIRKYATVTKFDKMWTRCLGFAIEDPFNLDHNLGNGLSANMNTYIRKVFIKARSRFGTPIDQLPPGYAMQAQEYFFDADELTQGYAPPNDRGCRRCGRIGHFMNECPLNNQKGRQLFDNNDEGEQQQQQGKSQQQQQQNKQQQQQQTTKGQQSQQQGKGQQKQPEAEKQQNKGQQKQQQPSPQKLQKQSNQESKQPKKETEPQKQTQKQTSNQQGQNSRDQGQRRPQQNQGYLGGGPQGGGPGGRAPIPPQVFTNSAMQQRVHDYQQQQVQQFLAHRQNSAGAAFPGNHRQRNNSQSGFSQDWNYQRSFSQDMNFPGGFPQGRDFPNGGNSRNGSGNSQQQQRQATLSAHLHQGRQDGQQLQQQEREKQQLKQLHQQSKQQKRDGAQ